MPRVAHPPSTITPRDEGTDALFDQLRQPECDRERLESAIVALNLPLADASVDVVVNFQVIEHLWDQGQFVAECFRVLRPGGALLMSTPNRITFSPGRDTPLNPFHTRELNAAELTELLTDSGFRVEAMLGVFHGTGLAQLDAKHGGSIIDAQITRALANAPWPADLLADVESVGTADFDLVDARERDIDQSLDL